MSTDRKNRVLELFAEWKQDRYAFSERHEIPITLEVGRDPKAGAMRSIAQHVLGDERWMVEEVIASDPLLIILRDPNGPMD